MIETDKLIYIQMQKTGCTRIGEIITELCGGKSVGRKHGTLLEKPKDKSVIGSIRNPWDWYVSLWAFGCEGRGGVLSWLKDDPGWQRVYSDSNNVDLFRQWLKMVYSEKYISRMQNGYNKFSLAPQVGLMTWRFAYLYLAGVDVDRVPHFDSYDEFDEYEKQNNMVDYLWVSLEDLYPTIAGILLGFGGMHSNKLGLLFDLCKEKSNLSNHRPYQEYYDHESYTAVLDREKLIIDKFNYATI